MKQFGGIWLPDGEEHFVEWMAKKNKVVDGKLTYQFHKLEAALKHVKQFRHAVDVGAHCGLWSMHLVNRFQHVSAFEPIEDHRACFLANVRRHNFHLYPVALGEKDGTVGIKVDARSTGGSHVDGDGDVPLCRLDSFALQNVDFIKLDCEGYEYFVLKGSEEMLKTCKPCVLVEQKRDFATKYGLRPRQAVEFLQALGAVLRFEMGGDYCLSWETGQAGAKKP